MRGVDVTTLGSVVDNRSSNRQSSFDHCGRRNRNTGFLKIRHDAGIHGVAICRYGIENKRY